MLNIVVIIQAYNTTMYVIGIILIIWKSKQHDHVGESDKLEQFQVQL